MLSEALARATPRPGARSIAIRRPSRWPRPRTGDAQVKIAEHVGRWPDDIQTRMLARPCEVALSTENFG
jgi:hypothetical protein